MLNMAHALASEDVAAMLLWFADGDPEMDLAEVLDRVEAFQAAKGGFFRITERDFRNAFWHLGRELEFEMDPEDPWCFLPEGDPIRKWIVSILTTYDDVYFNDEGEHWTRLSERRKETAVDPDFWEKREAKLRRISDKGRSVMLGCFRDPERSRPDRIMEMLAILGWNREIISGYLSSGCLMADEEGPLDMDRQHTIRWRYVHPW
jgi:hypothetical protein